MLQTIKLLLGITDTSKDALLNALIDLAKSYAVDYCNLAEYSTALDTVVIKMVIEDYNKQGNEGLNSTSASGISESYINGYSDNILKVLNKHRKLKML